jgi:acetoin utilization deacetylase AcuC-like enzyme
MAPNGCDMRDEAESDPISATALVMHPDCARHDTGWGHPEHQGRLPAIVQVLHRDTPDFLHLILQSEAPPATLEMIRRVHEEPVIERLEAAARTAEQSGELQRLDADTVVSPATWDAALAAAGSAVHAVELVATGRARTAFALSRPPGHHATPHQSMGFCLFNNVAVAARVLQCSHGVERVLIVDWDVHHGNGTQDIFYGDPSVYYLSLHLAGHYPGTGGEDERGVGAGRNSTRNVCFHADTTRDDYMRRFADVLDTVCEEFRPDFIIVSAGYDCLAGDPLGGLPLEPEDLHAMTRLVMDLAARTAAGRVVCVLEGGYAPPRVAQGVRSTLRALAGLE